MSTPRRPRPENAKAQASRPWFSICGGPAGRAGSASAASRNPVRRNPVRLACRPEQRVHLNIPAARDRSQSSLGLAVIGEPGRDGLLHELADVPWVSLAVIENPSCGLGRFLHRQVVGHPPLHRADIAAQVQPDTRVPGLGAPEHDELVDARRHVPDAVDCRGAGTGNDRVRLAEPLPCIPVRRQPQPRRVDVVVPAHPGPRDPVKAVPGPLQPAAAYGPPQIVVVGPGRDRLRARDEPALPRRRIGDNSGEPGAHAIKCTSQLANRASFEVSIPRGRGGTEVYVTVCSMNTPHGARARQQSLRAHARNAAVQDPAYSAQERLRFFAFCRFLARIFADQPDDWALKGAGALLARIPIARASNDLDLVGRASLDLAGERLRQAAAVDLDDGFTFTIAAGSRSITGNNRGLRFTAEARIGPYRLATFRVDVVVDWTNTRPLDTVPPATPIPTVPIPGPLWRVYPIADHLADKVCATYEYVDPIRSTRFHDLVDIALIACNLSVRGDDLATALESERRRRCITLPHGYMPPDQATWERGFTRLRRAAGPLGAKWPSYPEAVAIAQALLDPVLANERHDGTWDPAKRQWVDDHPRLGVR
jgi:hypothetical protein